MIAKTGLTKSAPSARRNKYGATLAAAALIFFLATVVRVVFAIAHPHFDNLFSVRGVPYSDGLTWTRAAFSLAAGNGLGGVYRPLYSVFLALFYTWHFPPFTLITIANIVFSALTASFIYLIADRSFNRLIAIAVASFFIFDPAQLVQIPQAATEPFGLMLSTASIYYLLLTDRPANLRLAILSGVLLVLSNLARPLTLFCAPFYVLYLMLQELWERRGIKRALIVATAFCIAISICLAPWLIRQKLVNNIWAISTNLGEAFYAATSPRFKVWTPQVRVAADRAGIPPDQGHRYRFFMAKGWDQLRQNPAFYFSQCGRAFWVSLNSFREDFRRTSRLFNYREWTRQVESMRFFFWVISALLLGATIYVWRRDGALAGAVSLLVSSAVLILWRIAPPSLNVLLLIIGVLGGCWFGSARRVALLAGTFIFSLIGIAMFNNAILYRGVLMTDWIFALFHLAAFYFIVVAVTSLVLKFIGRTPASVERHPLVEAGPDRLNQTVTRIAFFAGTAAALFVVLSSARLLYLNFAPDAAKESRPVTLNTQQRSEIKKRISELRSDIPSASLVEVTHLTRDIYYFPANEGFAERDPIFASASYDRSILRTSNYTVVVPGKIPCRVVDTNVALVGYSCL